MRELLQYYPFDFIAIKDGEYRFVEYKKRSHQYGKYPTVFFPAQKYAQCKSWARELGVPFYIFIEWEDKIKYCNAMSIHHSITLAGRRDRTEWDVFQPMVEFDIRDFSDFFCDYYATTEIN